MGDGGVACMSLQQHIMETFPVPTDKSLCGVKSNGNGFSAKSSTKLGGAERKKKMKVKKQKLAVKNTELNRGHVAGLSKNAKSNLEDDNVENGEVNVQKEEVEEGELGTLKWPRGEVENGEFLPEKSRRSEIEKGEVVGEKWRKGIEKGDFFSSKWRSGDREKSEILITPEKSRKGDSDKGDSGSWRTAKDENEIEKGEFIPDRWQKGEMMRDDYSYSKTRRYELGKEKGRKYDNDRILPAGINLADDFSWRKELSRSGSQNSKSTSRWESFQERNSRISSKIVDQDSNKNDYINKNEYNNDKNNGREYLSSNRLKRYDTDSDSTERKHFGDCGGLKSRRLTDDGIRPAHSEHHSRRSMERSYRVSSSARVSSSSRHYDSPLSSRLSYERHGRSPGHSERSPRDRARYHNYRDRSPVHRDRSPYNRERSPFSHEKSPYDRSRHYDHRPRSPSYVERSPQDRVRYSERRDRTSSYLDRSPFDYNRSNSHRETAKKSGTSEKFNAQFGNRVQEDKSHQKDPRGRDSSSLAKEAQEKSGIHYGNESVDTNGSHGSCKEESETPADLTVNCKEFSHVYGACEEPPSMEEDMDICDTPPHVPLATDSSTGKWFYVDYYGVECGPSKLCDLKVLVEEGALVSDHLIKHFDSDRWFTVENAVSPVVAINFSSIVSDSITQLVSPPEAPGNVLVDTAVTLQDCETAQFGIGNSEGQSATLEPPNLYPDNCEALFESLEDLHIDERVGALLQGVTIIPGRELESVGEALQMTFEMNAPRNALDNSEDMVSGFSLDQALFGHQFDQKTDILPKYSDIKFKDGEESKLSVMPGQNCGVTCVDSDDWFSGRWSCKGGDWKRNDEAAQDRPSRKKLVLNHGFPLCQISNAGYEDPRHHEDDLYCPLQSNKLDLPPWGFSCPDEKNDSGAVSRSMQSKPALNRGVKGTMLPVVRINACVVKDHDSLASELRVKVKAKDRYSSRSRPHSITSDGKRSSAERDSQSKAAGNQGSNGHRKSMASINVPKDRVCTADDLRLPLGDWYYLDGAGRERGPLSIADLHLLVDEGLVPRQSSIFRKSDQLWVPVMSAFESYQLENTVKSQQEKSSTCSEISAGTLSRFDVSDPEECNSNLTSFHNHHPQFIGYTRGKLHEFVMKSYKSREFAAAVNVVLETWINVRQPKKEIEKHTHWKSEIDARVTKRARIMTGEFEEDYEMEVDLNADQKDEFTFEDLYGDATFNTEENAYAESSTGSWGLLNGQALARVFHFLRSDLKSLAFASVTCRHWRTAVRFYKGISRQVDFSSFGASCDDYHVLNIMRDYNKEKVDSMVLLGCTNISSPVLEEILASFPLLSSVDVRGCTKLGELVCKYTNVKWIQNRSSFGSKSFEGGHCKMRSLTQISDKYSSLSKAKGLNGDSDEFGELNEYFESVDKRDSANQLFRRSLYKRSKLFDARRSSSILSRDARMRQWAIKKSEIGYKRMQEFLASSLKSIMKENTYDFFVPKVQEIQDRLKKGYYIGHGLSSVKEDISRMCRDAIKAKNRGDAGDMNPILTSFIQLVSRLEGSFKSSIEKEVKLKSLEDDSTTVFASATASKYRKKLSKMSKESKYKNRSSASSFANGGLDHGEYASDREIKRRLSRLNKKTMESGSDTSDDFERSSGKSESESSVSDTESDLDVRSEGRTGESRGDEYFTLNERFDVTTDDREWGARMTKASLVPPVTRKYEVIDQYVIVADEEDVQRKMRVSLPDDFSEKLKAQKNGTEELDMELPEVKDYKPRKQLGDEVLEQEVYGIDPYTHNLVLDSIPDGLDWPLQDKHLFVEDVLLRTLNKLVRNFTGTGNTPMMYHLQPVIEEIERNADAWDRRTIRICQGILNAIEKRPDDKYVAYRKGLGVVCNREGGFSTDDFIVEFLGEVYPVWKWFEKQDGIRSLQKNNKDPAPEFYNIYLERPKGDADGYDLVVVDAMHKANYASRICHSCRPNCEAKVTAVDGHYQIGIYAVRDIQYGEEITFDYNSVTESKEEYEASVCLCGSQVCRGSYLNLTGEGAFQKVLEEWHGILDRHHLMVEACEVNLVTEEDYLDLGRAGLGSCLLGGLPDWVVAYSARLVRFINFERTKLPEEILKHNLEEKRKYFSDICLELEKSDAEVQAEGVYNQRLQNLAVTLDKVRYVMRCIFGDPKNAPPPLEKLSPEDTVSFLWKGDGSLVEELLQSMVPHVEEDLLNELRSKVHACDPMESDDVLKELQTSLLWLRDEVRNLPCTYKSRHDAAADLIHIYAYTKCFFRIQKYKAITSPPVYISPLDLGPNYADKLRSGFQEYCKTYGENYCLGQLIFWYNQTNAEPDCSLARASKGCLSLPDIGSFYAKVQKPSKHRVYGPKTVRFMLARMEKQPQRSWPKDRIWCFKSSQNVLGSPMMDAILYNTTLDKEMVRWLKSRPAIFQAMWDQ